MKNNKLFPFLTTLSLLLSIIFKFIPFVSSFDNLWLAIFDYVFNISLSIFTAMLAYYFIDNVIENRRKKEEKLKKKEIYRKLQPNLSEFYQLYIDLYTGMRIDPVDEMDPILSNIFMARDELLLKLKQHINFLSPSPYINGKNFNANLFLNNKSYQLQYLKWYEVFLNSYYTFYVALTSFRDNYSMFMSSKALQSMSELISILHSVCDVYDKIKKSKINIGVDSPNNHIEYDIFFKVDEVMLGFEKFMIAINEEIDVNLLVLDMKQINQKESRPKLGELIAK